MTSQFMHVINNVKQLMSNPHPTIKNPTKVTLALAPLFIDLHRYTYINAHTHAHTPTLAHQEDKFMYIRSKLGEQVRYKG